ncbi:glycerol-3-phosphate dehydrogenase, partial [Candidatus Symbiopectobacterium sp. NZEC135]|nr:glycerol-3-phosphate dehydrogenase [Candidatus Symbiopectobacterium sp. NZEC135]
IHHLGENSGHDLYEAELRYLADKEWVVSVEDAIWRRTKLGMWLNDEQKQRVTDWLSAYRQSKVAAQ